MQIYKNHSTFANQQVAKIVYFTPIEDKNRCYTIIFNKNPEAV